MVAGWLRETITAQLSITSYLSGQLAIANTGRCCLNLGTDIQCRRRLLVQLDVHAPAPE